MHSVPRSVAISSCALAPGKCPNSVQIAAILVLFCFQSVFVCVCFFEQIQSRENEPEIQIECQEEQPLEN